MRESVFESLWVTLGKDLRNHFLGYLYSYRILAQFGARPKLRRGPIRLPSKKKHIILSNSVQRSGQSQCQRQLRHPKQTVGLSPGIVSLTFMFFVMHALSGPVLRDTARLSQRYPPSLRDMGFLVSQHGQLGAIPPPICLSVSHWRACEVEVRYPPSKGGISAIPAR